MSKPEEPKGPENRRVPALRVKQWQAGWDAVHFSDAEHRRKPEPHFYMASIPAVELRSLCGISRRDSGNVTPRAVDLGIQRRHDGERSEEIARYKSYGFPWSTLSEAKRASEEFNDLRKPGWLPTAIVVNIIGRDDIRQNGARVDAGDIVRVEGASDGFALRLPYLAWSSDWKPKALPPLEVIDGQHRLFAFDGSDTDFELPVVAFSGLDVSWQAYLFWTINIKPKRINSSLAFDLYPLLRGEDWLDRAEGHQVYRDTRSQELTEALWSHTSSAWYDHINMLGDPKTPGVSQSAWVKALSNTFVRPWRGRGAKLGGLFGGRLSDEDEVLGWSRAQQAAFLIYAWSQLQKAVKASDSEWARDVRLRTKPSTDVMAKLDPAFYGRFSMISTDQGVRGILQVLNDVCIATATHWDLRNWSAPEGAGAADQAAVTEALETLSTQRIARFLTELTQCLATFDWRSSAVPELSNQLRLDKLVFRGSGGYAELRLQLLAHLAKANESFAEVVRRVEALT